jgi:hypothetical protein
MEAIEAIPEDEKIWLGKNLFRWKGQTWIYMGAWAGWMRADTFQQLEDGTLVGSIFRNDKTRSEEALSMLKNTARRLAQEQLKG